MKKDNVVERMFLALLTVNIPPALLAAALRLCYSSVTRGFLDVVPSLQTSTSSVFLLPTQRQLKNSNDCLK